MEQNSPTKLNINLDLRVITALLLLVIAGMLVVWKPWASVSSSDRTITVSGEAKLTSEPDEFTFQPSYEFKEANKETALAALTAKSEELVRKLKELGVSDNKIKINSDGYDYRNYSFDSDSDTFTYTLYPKIVINTRELAQKVQDYLVSTLPSGQISPQTGFSDTKQKELESKARDTATKDARKKADQSAENLGFKVSKVKSIEDSSNFGEIWAYGATDASVVSAGEKSAGLALQPGEDELTYTVKVVYYIK